MTETQHYTDLKSKLDYVIKLLESTGNQPLHKPRPMTLREAARHLNMTEQGIYNRVHLKTIPFHKNGKLYFYQEELDAFINGTWKNTTSKK